MSSDRWSVYLRPVSWFNYWTVGQSSTELSRRHDCLFWFWHHKFAWYWIDDWCDCDCGCIVIVVSQWLINDSFDSFASGCNLNPLKKNGGGRHRSRSRSAGAESCDGDGFEDGIFVGPSRIEAATTKFDAVYMPPKKPKKQKVARPAQPESKARSKKQSKMDAFIKRRR